VVCDSSLFLPLRCLLGYTAHDTADEETDDVDGLTSTHTHTHTHTSTHKREERFVESLFFILYTGTLY